MHVEAAITNKRGYTPVRDRLSAHAVMRALLRAVAPPAFPDAEQTRKARVLHTWLWCCIGLCATVLLVNSLFVRANLMSNIASFGIAMLGSMLLLVLVQRGHVRFVTLTLTLGVIGLNITATIWSQRPFSLATAAGFVTFVFAGTLLPRREIWRIVLVSALAMLATGAYWLTQTSVPIRRETVMFDMLIYAVFSGAIGVIVHITTGQLSAALEDARANRAALALRARSLEQEVSTRQAAEARQQRLTAGLQSVLSASGTLMRCETSDDLWRNAVEFARTALGVDRCSAYVREAKDSPWFAGTWGTDMSGDTVDERHTRIHIADQESRLLAHLGSMGNDQAGWRLRTLQAQPGWQRSVTDAQDSPDWVADTPIFGSDGSLIGVFFNDNARRGAAANKDQQDLLALYCAMVGRIAERKALEVENERLHREQVRGAAVAERSRLARELHDSVSQALFGIVLGVRTLKDNGLRNDALNAQALDYVFSLSESALSEMRSLVQALRPEVLERDGLRVALRHQAEVLCQRSGINVTIDVGEIEPQLPIDAKEALYRIGLEAIQNALKHAHANDISVRMAVQDGSVVVSIADNGLGFDPDKPRPGHYGQQIMRERAHEYGGTLSVDSQVGAGTSVRVTMPLRTPAPA